MKLIWQSIEFVWNQFWHWFEKIITLLGGRTIAMLAVALLITMVSVIFTDNWIVTIARQVEVIGQIRTNIITLNKLKANLYEAESAQRGYLFTKRDIYIAPFNKALGDARDNISKIESLVINTSSGKDQLTERDWLKSISASLEAKAAEMKVTVNLARSGKLQEAKQVMNLDDGIIEMKKFMQYTDTLIQNQYATLDELIQVRKNTTIMARTSVFVGALLLIFLVVLVIKQLLKEIVIKSQLQQQVLEENEIYEVKLQQQTVLVMI